MASILKISDGTTTVDFLASDGIYRVTAWAPAVAGRRASAIGGRGPYEDVVEQMEISVKGATAAASLETLQRLLDQATRWGMGEPVDAVVLSFKPTATSDELKATILGPAAPGEAMVELPENVVNAAALGMIEPVVLRFRRTGVWLGAINTYATTFAKANPEVAEIKNILAVSTDSPFLLQMLSLPSRSDIINESFILVTSGRTAAEAERIFVTNAHNLSASGTQFANVTAESNRQSVSGNNLRYTVGTSGNVVETSGTVTLPTVVAEATRHAVFLNYRTLSTTATFQVRAVMYANYDGPVYGPWVTIEPEDNAEPRYAYMGTMSSSSGAISVYLQARGTVAAQQLLFDTIAVMAMDSPSDRVIAIPKARTDGYTTSFTAATFNLDHRLLTHTNGAAYFSGLTWPLSMSYQGDVSLWMTANHTAINVAWLGTGGPLTGKWRAVSSGNSVPVTSMNVLRSKAYLIPR